MVIITDNTQQVKQRLRADLLASLQEIGGRIEDDTAAKLNDPYPPASEPGTDPHRRTGNLRAGVGHLAEETGTGARVTIYSNRASGDPLVPLYLNEGTSRMAARPFFTMMREEWTAALPNEFPALLRSKF